ncbi:low temperature requirement A protein (LtrA) [Amycolatopsis echigonensis]|uniref:Low temperature requirement A protein (LtrA) n=1 Tax=Amycolatopsis echigonensis TaxID=2576905 RepID=A0A2N3W9J1_9PSEU|nr:low temperature requirement protein A [Amycolatopsis niigatensis]PKV90543.1 low temperature requirement A protein (LtrA) [Amycolatopsis niigatensis]
MIRKTEERHASWLELFFDLVAVAGVAQLSHLVRGTTSWSDAGLYVVCFLAFWTAWMCFTVYGNVTGEAARTMPVLLAMAGLVFMAGAVHDIGEHAQAFAIAYVAVRGLASRVWESRENTRIIVEWPVVHAGMGVVPWFVSFWVDAPWKYALWALGLGIDLVAGLTMSGERVAARLADRASQSKRPLPGLAFAHLDLAHFGERLGLFTIIVLGEGVLTVTEAMTEAPDWEGPLFWTVLGVLALLAALWGAALFQGFGGIPYLAQTAWGPRILLPVHCLVAGLLAALAAGFGDVVESVSHGHVAVGTRWLLCGCVAAFTVVGVVARVASGTGKRWDFVAVLAGAGIPAGLGFAGGALTPARFLWVLVVAVLPGLVREFPRRRRVAAPDGP